ncbi:peptidylprolyl isomerase [Alicyclobacillus shizuokensis]|uniref:peptidylprolyl isomerase n=1 Tax=Alicyclobacillus shizuokensis TaxID=392014 RepID=UPI0008363FB1|nr:peptidylprolyl isomerase [Alicyclobacillus shizuokensis]MCL6626482.1 peptidylprolyl isomerase [Alicyclobacillus shizuokensis]
MQGNRKWATAAVAVAVALAAAGCSQGTTGNQTNSTANQTAAKLPPEPKYSGPVVATYNGGKLTKQELDEQYNLQVVLPKQQSNESKKQFTSDYIMYYKYLYNKALQDKKAAPDASTAQQYANEAISQLYSAQGAPYKSKEAVLNAMKKLGLTKNDLILYFAKYERLQNYFQDQMSKVKPTTKQMQAYYNQHKSDYVQVTVDTILLNKLSTAQSVEKQLKAGASFKKLADKYSKDPSVKDNHGHLTNQLVSQFVAPFAKACRTLPIGQISDPVKSNYGYHILKVDKRTQLSFAKAKSTIEQQLAQQLQQQKQQQIQQDALKNSNIKILVKDKDL